MTDKPAHPLNLIAYGCSPCSSSASAPPAPPATTNLRLLLRALQVKAASKNGTAPLTLQPPGGSRAQAPTNRWYRSQALTALLGNAALIPILILPIQLLLLLLLLITNTNTVFRYRSQALTALLGKKQALLLLFHYQVVDLFFP